MENIQSEKEKKLEYPMARTFYCRTEIFCLIKSNFDELSFAIFYLEVRMFKNLKLIHLTLKLFSQNTIIFYFFSIFICTIQEHDRYKKYILHDYGYLIA